MALGSYRNSPFTTGQDSSWNGLKTEILDYEAGEWKPAADYPSDFTSGGDKYVNQRYKFYHIT